jgi:hypothetical protein
VPQMCRTLFDPSEYQLPSPRIAEGTCVPFGTVAVSYTNQRRGTSWQAGFFWASAAVQLPAACESPFPRVAGVELHFSDSCTISEGDPRC